LWWAAARTQHTISALEAHPEHHADMIGRHVRDRLAQQRLVDGRVELDTDLVHTLQPEPGQSCLQLGRDGRERAVGQISGGAGRLDVIQHRDQCRHRGVETVLLGLRLVALDATPVVGELGLQPQQVRLQLLRLRIGCGFLGRIRIQTGGVEDLLGLAQCILAIGVDTVGVAGALTTHGPRLRVHLALVGEANRLLVRVPLIFGVQFLVAHREPQFFFSSSSSTTSASTTSSSSEPAAPASAPSAGASC
jgi:hypothetical protein